MYSCEYYVYTEFIIVLFSIQQLLPQPVVKTAKCLQLVDLSR